MALWVSYFKNSHRQVFWDIYWGARGRVWQISNAKGYVESPKIVYVTTLKTKGPHNDLFKQKFAIIFFQLTKIQKVINVIIAFSALPYTSLH